MYRLQIHEHFSKIPKSIRPARPRTQHGCHHDTKVKPEAATAVIELLMMGGRTPKTCWAVNKHHDNKLKNRCIWFVIYLNSTKQSLQRVPRIWLHLSHMPNARQESKDSPVQTPSSPPNVGTRYTETSLVWLMVSAHHSQFTRDTQCHMVYR